MKSIILALLFIAGSLLGSDPLEIAVLAGGCFWGVEGVFEEVKGVVRVDSGYSGGREDTATYKIVSSGKSNHAESVEIVYDPSVISFRKLLEVFFLIVHDPTQLNYQGPDKGREYRSVVFYNSPQQKKIAQEYIDYLEKNRVYPSPIVTILEELDRFYHAEEYHQDFIKNNPGNAYVCYWDIPKIKALREKYPELVK